MFISVLLVLHIFFDHLISEEANMKNTTEKPTGSRNKGKRTKYKYTNICVGAGLLLIGMMLLLFKAFSPDYLDAVGYLYEKNFVLIPVAFLLIVSGGLSFLMIGIKNITAVLRSRDDTNRKRYIILSSVCVGIVAVFVIMFILLITSNS